MLSSKNAVASFHHTLQQAWELLLKFSLNGCYTIFHALEVDISILQQELVQDVAVVPVDSCFVQAGECLFLKHEIWVNKGSDLLAEVNCFIHGNLSCFFFVLFKDDGKGLHVFAIVFKVNFNFWTSDFWRIVVQAQFRKKLMKTLDTSRTENFVEDFNFVWELMADLEEAIWQLSNVNESNFQVLPEIGELILVHESGDHITDNSRISVLINLVNDLFLTIKVNTAAHKNQRSIERVFIDAWGSFLIDVPSTLANDFVVNALLLALVVNWHVS